MIFVTLSMVIFSLYFVLTKHTLARVPRECDTFGLQQFGAVQVFCKYNYVMLCRATNYRDVENCHFGLNDLQSNCVWKTSAWQWLDCCS